MIVLVFVCVLSSCFLSVYLLNYKKELKKITAQLKNITDGSSHKYIDIMLMDQTLEELAAQMNQVIRKQEQMYINTKNEEQKLKESIADISHDLRTPLTSILGHTFLLKNSDTQDMQASLEIIEKKAELLNSLINSFYELSVLDDDNTSFVLSEIDVVKILTDCLISNHVLLEKQGIVPDIVLPDEAVLIHANEIACERIFQNLISNAVQYSTGKIAVELQCTETDCVITFANSSEFLGADAIARLSDRFYRNDNARSSGSSGLGLYIVKVLLSRTGGSLKDIDFKDGWLIVSVQYPLQYASCYWPETKWEDDLT